MNRCLLLLLTLLLLSTAACTNYANLLDSWVGHNEQELLDRWGEPDSRSKRGTGQLLTYERFWKDAGGALNRGRLKFLVDETGTIVNWTKSNYPDYLFGDEALTRP